MLKQCRHGNILIECFPMNAASLADEPPVFQFLVGGIRQTGKPIIRHANFPPIFQQHKELICLQSKLLSKNGFTG